MSRLLLKIVIAIVVSLVIVLIRVLINAIRSRSRAKSYTSTLPPPPKGGAGPKSGARKPVLVGVAGVYKGAIVPMDAGPVVIGRDPSSANLVFPDEQRTISSKHCLVKVDDGRFFLEDCYSTNGTYLVNGRSLTPGQAVELKPGERFTIGDRKNTFEVSFR